MVEEIDGGGSQLFFEERLSTFPSLATSGHSSLWGEAMKTPFYATVPTKTNFVFQKRSFTPLVFLGCWLTIFTAFRLLSWGAFWTSLVLALCFWAAHEWLKLRVEWAEETLALVVIVSWAVILTNLLQSSMLFTSDAFNFGQGFVYYLAHGVTDWNWGGVMSARCRFESRK